MQNVCAEGIRSTKVCGGPFSLCPKKKKTEFVHCQ